MIYRDPELPILSRKHDPDNPYPGSTSSVGWCNGCFDLIHRGHLFFLKRASQISEILVVGVNSDMSVKKNKGESRPIQDEDTRAQIIDSLEFVDHVVIFDAPTPKIVVASLLPDVLIQSIEYHDYHDYDWLQEYQDRLVFLPRLDDIDATSDVVEKIKSLRFANYGYGYEEHLWSKACEKFFGAK